MDNHQNHHDFDEQFNDLPLPDADKSWQKMKELLEEKDERRRVIPFGFANCAGWGLALLVAGGLALYFLKPQNWFDQGPGESSTPSTVNSNTPSSNANSVPHNKNIPAQNEEENAGDRSRSTTEKTKPNTFQTPGERENRNNLNSSHTSAKHEQTEKGTNTANTLQKSNSTGIDVSLPAPVANRSVTRKQASKKSIAGALRISGNDIKTPRKQQTTATVKTGEHLVTDSDSVSQSARLTGASRNTESNAGSLQQPSGERSTERVQGPDSVKAKPVVDSNLTEVVKKEDKNARRKWAISAGIGEQQQIAMGEQRAVATTSSGRTNTLRDYIPSVYLRLERKDKWFLQSEFRYGAPQMLKEFAYSKQTTLSNVSVVNTTTYRLKKTYYHQFPISFNYYIGPKFSVGAGAIFNRFYGAVSEREVISEDVFTQQVSTSKEVVRIDHFTDSFLYKTQTNLLFQAGYHWKAFTFSLRYTGDIQPFMKYTRPDGVINVRKNATLQFVAQLRLWQRPKAVVKKAPSIRQG